ncbi:MAG: Asp-tRNA(Asn)/Glu-tRNA(Gln) amidotransferase subunit GatA [bacterium]|jgi:aspartyl-tRNA(Asn)/glutamyl-tRNA(Gln) amidotransferase subunit A
MELWKLPAHSLHKLLAGGEVTAQEITTGFLQRLREVDPSVQAFITVTEEMALRQAREVDRRREEGEELPPLAGIPFALKDNISVRDIPTTCGSKMLENYIPVYDATVYERLREAGAVLVGKTNMDEFAMGSSTEFSAFHITRNPWNPDRVPGGSSGGSAAAIGAGAVSFALGSDTGGSIRQPASFCGIVGMKPTYGRVSRYGVIPFACSLDQVGPLAKNVTDAALVLNVISGHDQRDSTALKEKVPDYTSFLVSDVAGLKIGVPREYYAEGIEPEVGAAVWEGIRLLEKLGASVEETSLPTTSYGLSAYYIIAVAEASSNLACFDGVRYGYRADAGNLLEMYTKSRRALGPEVRRRIMLGTYALSAGYYEAYYHKAQQVRTLIRQEFHEAFKKYDVLITPTSPTVAFKIGTKVNDPLAMYLSDVCTLAVNMAGLPAITIPCGFSQGLPIGMQIMGKPFAEGKLLQVAYTFEQETQFHKQFPPASEGVM